MTKENKNNNNDAPEKKFNVGGVIASVWANKSKDDTVYRNVSLVKRYMDETSKEWKDATSFNVQDLPKVNLVISEAYKYIALKESE